MFPADLASGQLHYEAGPVDDAVSAVTATAGDALAPFVDVHACVFAGGAQHCLNPTLCPITGPAGDIDWGLVSPLGQKSGVGAWASFADQQGGAFAQAVYMISGGCPQG